MTHQPIIVRGGTADQRTIVRDAAHWMRSYLLGKRLANNVLLYITLSKNLSKTGAMGECDFLDSNHRPRNFTIKLAAEQKPKQLLITLAHEMVHVKQFAKDEMFDYVQEHLTRWKGKVVNLKIIGHTDLPWEIEAWEMQTPLLIEYRFATK